MTGAAQILKLFLLIVICPLANADGRNAAGLPLIRIVIDEAQGDSVSGKLDTFGLQRANIVMKVRGSSSKLRPKKPLRIEFQDEFGKDLKFGVLGLPADSDWILYPSYIDKSLVRDALAFDLWRELGYYAPRWRYVELFIVTNEAQSNLQVESEREWLFSDEYRLVPQLNLRLRPRRPIPPEKPWIPNMPEIEMVWPGISNQGIGWENYHGVYIVMEKIKRGKERLNIKKLKPEHAGEPVVTGGYIFKKDRLNEGEKGFKTKSGIEFAFEEPKERDVTAAQRAYLTKYLNEFEDVLFGSTFNDPEHGYRKYIDVESFIDYHWMTEISRNVDGYWFSVFLHKDRGGKLKMGPVWDWDLAFGNSYFQQTFGTNGWRWERLTKDQFYRWYVRLFEDADFLQRYIDRWAELRTNVLAASNILGRIDKCVAEISSAAIDRNYKRWPTLGKPLQKVSFTGDTYQEEIDWLKNWIAGRLAWIDTQDFPPPAIHHRDIQPASDLLISRGVKWIEVSMAWLVGQAYYTLDGSDPRLPGGGVSPKAMEYKAPLWLAPGTDVCARVKSEEDLWSAPRVVRVE